MDNLGHLEQIENKLEQECPSCGSQLYYSAERKKLLCDHCGYVEEICNDNSEVVELNLENAESQASFRPEDLGHKVWHCDNCGSGFSVSSDQLKVDCGFCGSTNVNVEAYDHNLIKPSGIVPFYVSLDEALDKFKLWIKKGWFHPSKLKRKAQVEALHGLYIPFWTFDANIYAQWSGEAGHHYYTSVTTIVNGKPQVRQVQKTRWVYNSGTLTHFFDDILVVASNGLKQKTLEKVLPYRLNEVINFDPRYLLSWESEIYNLGLQEGYDVADQIMDRKIRHMCSAQLGGDTQRGLKVENSKTDQTYKHIVLPIWVAAYKYQNKVYQFAINGQTGKVYGKKPISYYKIAFLILCFVLFIFSIYLLKQSGIFAK